MADYDWQKPLTYSLLNAQAPAPNPCCALNLTHEAAIYVFN